MTRYQTIGMESLYPGYTIFGKICVAAARMLIVMSIDYMEVAGLPSVLDGAHLNYFMLIWVIRRLAQASIVETMRLSIHLIIVGGRLPLSKQITAEQISLYHLMAKQKQSPGGHG